jgi:uncharacterized protein with HEPN domain
MKRNVALYLKDIIENMDRAERFVKGMNCEDFVKDEKTGFAVIRCIEIMGEASKCITEDTRKKYPEIPWRDIAGMRDKVINFYFGVNLTKVWAVVKEDIPHIRPLLLNALRDLQG